MPELGEIRSYKTTGKKPRRFIWWACPDCGYQRWVQVGKGGEPTSTRCASCARKNERNPNFFRKGKKHHLWMGGRFYDKDGYIRVRIYPANPYYSMANTRGHVSEHRLVMAESLGRCLNEGEVVHHIDGVKTSNDPSNLFLMDKKTHKRSYADGYRAGFAEAKRRYYNLHEGS